MGQSQGLMDSMDFQKDLGVFPQDLVDKSLKLKLLQGPFPMGWINYNSLPDKPIIAILIDFCAIVTECSLLNQ